jgi:preprotein translocase subunit SecG
MITAVAILHLMVCVLLILIVLIQGGENVDIAAAFGGVSQAAFGPRGAISTMAKITWVLASIFVVTSITLAVWATKHSAGSVMEKAPTQQSVPSAPTPAKT